MTSLVTASIICIHACMLFSSHVDARHVPLTNDDLLVDSLMPVNTTKLYNSRMQRHLDNLEGSGNGDSMPIAPLGHNLPMQRLMNQAVSNDAEEIPRSREEVETADDDPSQVEKLQDLDEGSGASEIEEEGDAELEKPKTAPVLSDIDEPFKKEDGVKEILDHLPGSTSKPLDTNDNNNRDNALSVLGGDLKTPNDPQTSIEEQEEEGSGGAITSPPHFPIDVYRPSESTLNATQYLDTGDGYEKQENVTVVKGELVDSKEKAVNSFEGTEEIENVESTSSTQDNIENEANQFGSERSEEDKEEMTALTEDNESGDIRIDETTTEFAINEKNSTINAVQQGATDGKLNPVESVETSEETETEEPIKEDVAQVVTETLETTTENVVNVRIQLPASSDVLGEPAAPSTESISTTESSTEPRDIEDEVDEKRIQETTPESITQGLPIDATTAESTTSDVILQVAVLEESALGQREKITNPEEGLQNAGNPVENSLGAYILIGLIAICFMALIAFLVLRRRSRVRKARIDNNQERDPEKSLLSNGKFKEDSDENNVKNNEITPLVIKQNSQINKFEKSPNFPSPKNINTAVNDKNIEKDNVLKSTQAIIEEDEDAKKALEEEKKPDDENEGVDEEKKALMGENATTEKVIVRTHVDQDSIPKKPVLVTRNGNGYHAVSQDPV